MSDREVDQCYSKQVNKEKARILKMSQDQPITCHWTSLSSTQESCIPLFVEQNMVHNPVGPSLMTNDWRIPSPCWISTTHSFTRLGSSAWISLTWRFRNKSHFLMPSAHLIFSPLPAFLYYRNKWCSVWENEASQMIPAFTALKLPRCTFLPLPCALANRACTGMEALLSSHSWRVKEDSGLCEISLFCFLRFYFYF